MIARFCYILLVLTAFANYGTLASFMPECKDFFPSQACRNFDRSTRLCSEPTRRGEAFEICRKTCGLCW
ncbi:hypothetical protein RB195_003748 [Necator americanus]|uniref:Uncharacterized protein n=2 Tax=Necator americanus TaxID=51031 RepID=W2TEK2_NECAM|nr:hypothetical protein NECAME_09835 [Necator americanus]ETN79432.1 hypothetical protein NECAME_09835 [Necator americanus]